LDAASSDSSGTVLALVEHGEERVEDGRVGLEDLVEERDLGLGQLARGHALVAALLQRRQAHRPEDLLGRGELGQQPLEVHGAADAATHLLGQHGLGRAGRAQHQHVLLGQHRGERAVHQLVAFDEELLELPSHQPESFLCGHERRLARIGDGG
jgi:hypothetical protein